MLDNCALNLECMYQNWKMKTRAKPDLIVHNIPYLSDSTKHRAVSSLKINLFLQSTWCNPWFFAFRILKINPIFITSHNSIKKTSFHTFEEKFFWSVFGFLFSSYGTHFHTFWIIPMTFNRLKIVSWSTFKASAICFWVCESSLFSDSCDSMSSNFFGVLPCSSFFRSKILFLNYWNHS